MNLWWSGGGGGFAHQDYVNERNVIWAYDAAGNLTDSGDVQYTVDAAGRIGRTVSATENTYKDPNDDRWGFSHDVTQGLDGDGQAIKKVAAETTIYYNNEGNTTTTTTSYLLRSSVLGNRVVTEISETGRRGFVYLGSEVLAWQRVTGTTQSVLWEHRDPGNASLRLTDSVGTVSSSLSAELDPLGTNAGTTNQIPNPSFKSFWSYPGFGDTNMSSDSQCTLNGDMVPCSVLGFAARTHPEIYFNVHTRNAPPGFGMGLGGRWVEDTGPQTDPAGPGIDPDGIVRVNQNEDGLGHWELFPISFRDPVVRQFAHAPQNPSQTSAKGFPCPPSISEIILGRDQSSVGKVLIEAGELASKTGREEGGWIFMDRKGRLTAVLYERGSSRGQNIPGLGMTIVLDDPPVSSGSIVVATFHTHDSDLYPSQPIPWGKNKAGQDTFVSNDIMTNEAQGVPGIIVGSGLVKGVNGYGRKRGYWKQPLPKRCRK